MRGYITVREKVHVYKNGGIIRAIKQNVYHHVGSTRMLVRYNKLFREVHIINGEYYLYL